MSRAPLDLFYAPGVGEEPEAPRHGTQRRQLADLVPHLDPAPGGLTLVDVGGGSGSTTTALARAIGASSPVVVDVSEVALGAARRRGLAAVAVGTADQRLPVRSGSVDVVALNEVIEHVVDTDGLLEEVHRVLRPGGLLALTTPNLAAWFNRLGLAAGLQPAFTEVSLRGIYGRPGTEVVGHVRVMTTRALLELLDARGFDVLRVDGTVYPDLPRPAQPLDRFLARYPSLAAGVVVVAASR